MLCFGWRELKKKSFEFLNLILLLTLRVKRFIDPSQFSIRISLYLMLNFILFINAANRLTNVGSKAKSDDKSNNSPVRQADCINNFRISFIRIRAFLRLFFCPSRIYPPHYLIESDLRYGNSAPWEWVLKNREGRSNTAILRVSNCSFISVRLANLPKFIEITWGP